MKVFDGIELGPDLGYRFWIRVDELRSAVPCQLIDMAAIAGIDYTRIKNQRSANRLPKLEDAYQISRVLNCSMSYLVTGILENSKVPEKIQPFINALSKASDDDLELVRRVLRMEEPAGKRKDA